MSRFSKSEAEARGWVFVHKREERDIATAAGETRSFPASIRAEKNVGEHLLNEEAETMGLLLERIETAESRLNDRRNTTPAVVPEDIPRDQAGIEQRSVIVATEPGDLSSDAPVRKISDAELTTLARTDAVLELNEDGEPEMRFYGPTSAATDADEANRAEGAAVENRRAAEAAVPSAVQVEKDDSQAVVDTPGGATGSVLVLREDEEPGDLAERRSLEAQEAESARVTRNREIGFNPAPEGEEKLAGVGVSIADRAALGSEVPRQGQTAAAAEAILNPEPRDVPDVSPTEAPAQERQEAQEAAAEDLTAEHGKEADKPEHAASIATAGADAEQKLVDEAASGDESGKNSEESPTAPLATSAAKELAEEKGVDLSTVHGTGKDGKVTKPDVEEHLSQEDGDGESSGAGD